jgi:hypothetical protein
MIKRILVLFVLFGIACSGKKTQIDVVPATSRPFLVQAGADTTINGFKLTAPYFTISSMNVLWKGKGTLNILAITMENQVIPGAATTSVKVKCTVSGDDLKLVFPGNISTTTGGIQIAEGATTVTARAFGCGGISLPDPVPASLSIPVTLKVLGAISDPANPNNTTGRATGTTIINVL